MKTFEEKFTAWLDGALAKEEARTFEKKHPSVYKERSDLLRLRSLLNEHLGRAELSHPDLFITQIMAQVKREVSRRRVARPWLGVPRLAWGGIASLAASLALFVVLMPHGDLSNPRTEYVAEALKAKPLNPKVTTAVNSQKDMLEGVPYLPADKESDR